MNAVYALLPLVTLAPLDRPATGVDVPFLVVSASRKAVRSYPADVGAEFTLAMSGKWGTVIVLVGDVDGTSSNSAKLG
jgi:hypothetical protein